MLYDSDCEYDGCTAFCVAGDSESLMNHYVVGDKHATQVLDCLSHIVTVYGQHVIVLQYLHHVRDLVCCCLLFYRLVQWYSVAVAAGKCWN